MNIQAIIFDLYGVLGFNGWQTFKAKHFAENPGAWERLRVLGKRVDTGEVNQQALTDALVAATGETPAEVRHQLDYTEPNIELLAFIAGELKPNYRIGLLSNTGQDIFADLFTVDQRAMFDGVISSRDTGVVKPNLQAFLFACERLGTMPECCVMVDDKEANIRAARKLNMHGVLYKTNAQVIHDIRKLIASD